MDIETAEALDRLRIDLRRVESTLSGRIDRSETSLRAEIGSLRGELRAETGELRDGLRSEIGELRESLAENRRHTEVRFESVRDDIRIVAEAVAALTAKVDALNR
jgi:predicted  nucleic acid-binding Zn-ribbon protein